MKFTKLAIFATLLTMASTTFAATQASPGTSVTPTMQVSATVQTAIRLTLAASTGCAFSAPTGGQDYAMNFGTVDALAINTGCVGAGAGKYAPTNPGVSDDTIYYSNYTITPTFTSQAQSTGTISAYVSTNFAANDSLTVVHGGTSAVLPAQASFTAMGVGSSNSTNIATSAASGTALTRWIGVEVAHNNGAIAGVGTSQSATVTYTLTVP
jgi:hypothetical protein